MLTIRPADSSDRMLIHEMAKVVFPATYRNILSPEQLIYMMEWMYAPQNIEKQMNEGHLFFIAYCGNDLCGYASIQQEDEHLFHLQKLYVLPHFQGQHCGEDLFRLMIKEIKQLHPEPCIMELNVNRVNRAVGFYHQMGMTIHREGDFPIGQGYYMNDYIMRIEL